MDGVLKPVDAETNALINAFTLNQEIYFRGWVGIRRNKKQENFRERLLVITTFRTFILKNKGLIQQQVVKNLDYPLVTLRDMMVQDSNPKELTLVFADNEPIVIMHQHGIKDIVQAIMFAYDSIAHGRHDLNLNFSLPDALLDGFEAPEPDVQDSLLVAYLVECDLGGVRPSNAALDYFMACFHIRNTVFHAARCFNKIGKELLKPHLAVFCAVGVSKWFEEVIIMDVLLNKEGLSKVGEMIGNKSNLQRLTLSNNNVGKHSITPIVKGLEKGVHSLVHVDISNNNLGDTVTLALADALAKNKPLESLCLRNCNFGHKGFKRIAQLCCEKGWVENLEKLDLSQNKAGKAGTQALNGWLDTAARSKELFVLSDLFVADTELDLFCFLNTLSPVATKKCPKFTLLSISGNKASKKKGPETSLVANILTNCVCITTLNAVGCELNVVELLQAVRSLNQQDPERLMSVDLSSNEIGKSGATNLEAMFGGAINTGLATLSLCDTNLQAEGLISVAKAFCGKNIRALILDGCFKTGVLKNSGRVAGEALASLLAQTPLLEVLSLNGAKGCYMKSNLIPVFVALKSNKNLLSLSVSWNRLEDNSFAVLSEALKSNDTLTSLEMSRNRFTMEGFRVFVAAVEANQTLNSLSSPVNDIERLFNDDKKNAPELLSLFSRIEISLEHSKRRLESMPSKLAAPMSGAAGQKFTPIFRGSEARDSEEIETRYALGQVNYDLRRGRERKESSALEMVRDMGSLTAQEKARRKSSRRIGDQAYFEPSVRIAFARVLPDELLNSVSDEEIRAIQRARTLLPGANIVGRSSSFELGRAFSFEPSADRCSVDDL